MTIGTATLLSIIRRYGAALGVALITLVAIINAVLYAMGW